MLFAPMVREQRVLGLISVTRAAPGGFSADEIALLTTFADQAVIAIENVRLFKELESRNAALTESLEQQTATAEILRVISSSPTDVHPVLEAVATSAARLCGGADVIIHRVEGEFMDSEVHVGSMPSATTGERRPITPETPSGRAVLEGRTIHVHDIVEEL